MNYQVGWRSPANIAFTKYWGKKGHQLPCNTSLSLTLSECYTEMEMQVTPRIDQKIVTSFIFEGSENPKFSQKIENFLTKYIEQEAHWLNDFSFQFKSTNSFPHSSGIASSASSMSALALCLSSFEKSLGVRNSDHFLQEASSTARKASGSACRSLMPRMGLWGVHPAINSSRDEWAVEYNEYHPIFEDLCDAVMVISSKEKNVSSSAGHQHMAQHPYAQARFVSAQENNGQLFQSLKNGDWALFRSVVEREALTLHAMMMTGMNPFILLAPQTLAALELIQVRRIELDLPIAFTIDAGPNLHLLYPREARQRVESFISNELIKYCENGKIIYDHMGLGPVELTNGKQ